MHQPETVHYRVAIACEPGPAGYESQLTRQLQTAFPVTGCRHTAGGLVIGIAAAHPFADGALKDFADLVTDLLTGLGIAVTYGVVCRVTRPAGWRQRARDAVAGLRRLFRQSGSGNGGNDSSSGDVREIPVLYFYKGLRFDRELTARLRRLNDRRSPAPAI